MYASQYKGVDKIYKIAKLKRGFLENQSQQPVKCKLFFGKLSRQAFQNWHDELRFLWRSS